jgi:hypothetical protein
VAFDSPNRSAKLGAVTDGLVEAFWDQSGPVERRLFLDEALGRAAGAVTFEFDVFTVTLDFGRDMATVEDVLEADSSESIVLSIFLDRAASFGDDPNLGDGLTSMQRHPATFTVDQSGRVEPMDPPATGS